MSTKIMRHISVIMVDFAVHISSNCLSFRKEYLMIMRDPVIKELRSFYETGYAPVKVKAAQ